MFTEVMNKKQSGCFLWNTVYCVFHTGGQPFVLFPDDVLDLRHVVSCLFQFLKDQHDVLPCSSSVWSPTEHLLP